MVYVSNVWVGLVPYVGIKLVHYNRGR